MSPDPLPTVSERYLIERELGRGGMATVYLALDTKHGRRVALKLLRSEVSAAIGAERFRREIEILARLNHPHIVALHDSGAAGDRLWYVMPHVEGETLRTRLAREPRLPLAEATRLAREVASALGHAHRQGIVHRDVKPENVLLFEGLAQVADFGIAQREPSGDEATAFATTAGFAPGTLRYMAPEQIAGGAVDARTDLYALACVLYEMLTGAPPFAGPVEEVARQHLAEAAKPAPGVPQAIAEFLARGLAKSPDDRFRTAAQFVEALVAASAGGASAPTTGSLPRSRHGFVGREHELADCRALITESRLLTLVGIGGTGKTRLALRLAEEQLAHGPVFWADLAPVADPGRVLEAVAHAIGVRETQGKDLGELVAASLRAPGTWLVLDNCEHVPEAVRRLIDALPEDGLRILATSREPLGIAGERTYSLRPLALPAKAGAEGLEASEAGRFFLERVRFVQPGFVLTPANAATAAEICRRLDGIPLALELAAARVRVLSLEELRARLDDRFRLLTSGGKDARQQTLRATVQWSYDQLAPEEQELFRALSVFAGGWTLESAGAVVPGLDEFALIDALAHLVDKSLVFVERRGAQTRYGMLETLRQFGRERAGEAGETPQLAARHAGAFRALAEAAYAGRFDEVDAWGERLEADHDNLAAALEHLRASDPERYLELTGALSWFWQERSHLKEGSAHVRAALAVTPAAPARPGRARALWGAALMLAWQGAREEARRLMEEALAMLRALGDRKELGLALEGLGWVHFASGEDEASLAAFEECLALEVELGDPRRIARARAGLGQSLVALSRTTEARPVAEAIIADGAARGDRRVEHFGWHFLADCALIEERCADSLPLYRRSLELARVLGDRLEIAFEIQGVAMSLAGLGEPAHALTLAAAVEAEVARIGADIQVRFWNALLERFLGPARAALGPEAASRAWTAGRALPFDEAIARALDPGREAP